MALKNSYKLKGTVKIGWLFVSAIENYSPAHNTSEFWLCRLTLEKLMLRTRLKLSFMMPSAKFTVSLNRQEALAFHNSYVKGYIDTNEPIVMELFTDIDRTL